MKDFMAAMLRSGARAVLKKYKPKVIAITGSIGKTSAKEAIFGVVSARFRAHANIKNYNNEFGLPLTIIGAQSPKRSIIGWIKVFLDVVGLLYSRKDYAQVLVLELGIDRPGDMDYLMEIIQPDIAVLTTVGISHLEFFSGEEQIFNEKRKIFKNFGKGNSKSNTAILNTDDRNVARLISELSKQGGSEVITYGVSPTANVHIENYQISLAQSKQIGTTVNFNVHGKAVNLFLPNILGQTHVYALAVGIAAGLALHMKEADILTGLKNYKPQPGRMRLIPGPKNSIIVDDTYNAAPFSTQTALKELGEFPAPRKIAVLGDMLELGALSHLSHQDVAAEIQKYAIDYFVAVGPEMQIAAKELKHNHFNPANIFHFDNSSDAIETVRQLMTPNSIVLVKGSQGIRMEKIVKAIMAEPGQAGRLLCRQERDWLLK